MSDTPRSPSPLWNPYLAGVLLGLVLLASCAPSGRGLGATAAFPALASALAGGCTSGQALTGGAVLNAGSLVFMGVVLASAHALAYFVRKEWL